MSLNYNQPLTHVRSGDWNRTIDVLVESMYSRRIMTSQQLTKPAKLKTSESMGSTNHRHDTNLLKFDQQLTVGKSDGSIVEII